MKNPNQLKKELKKTKDLLHETQHETRALKKALWDILNYANLFLVLLDHNMNVQLVNWSLATKLGFEDEKAMIGKCWLDFIKPEEKTMIKTIYNKIADDEKNAEEYREITSEIVLPNEDNLVVKWFNIRINEDFNTTLSIGVQRCIPIEETEDSIRSYYRDIIDKDKTMIKSIREAFLNGTQESNVY